MVREKIHRLPSQAYQGYACVAVTVCTQNSERLFEHREIVHACSEKLFNSAQHCAMAIHVFLFMPDHLHVLMQGTSETSNALKFVSHFKQQTGYWFAKHELAGWQKGSYDHILRTDADIEKHVRYILENPVRAKIESDWFAYPYKGSTVYDFSKW